MNFLVLKKLGVDVLNRLLPASVSSRATSLEWLRARVMVGVLAANVIGIALVCIGTLAFTSFNAVNLALVMAFDGITLLGYVGCLFYYKRTANLAVAANLYGGCAYLGLLAPILVTGGLADSPVPQLMIVIPVWAFLMLGRRAGLVWTALILATITGLYALYHWGVAVPQVMEPQHVVSTYAGVYVLTLGITVGCLYVYEMYFETLTQRLSEEKNQFAHDAFHDALTGLLNRNGFERYGSVALEESLAEGTQVGLVYVDLDDFKPINDTYGHHEGDAVLQVVALRLQATVRAEDKVVRLGGDEFVVVVSHISGPEILTQIADKLLVAISAPMTLNERQLRVSASIGVVTAPDAGDSLQQLLRAADNAMYLAKKSKNRVCYFHAA